MSDPRWVHGLRRLVRDERFDVVHFHSPAVAAVARPVLRSLPGRVRPALGPGGEAGGRIRRDKTFFFAYYDGFRFKRGASNQLITVPTLKERQGDFTDFVDPSGNLIPVYDPATTRPDGAGGFTRNQISCGGVLNVICPDRLSGVVTKVFGYLPTPSNTGIVNNFLANGGSGTLEDRWGVKIDHAFNDKHRISGYFGWKRFTGTDPSSVSPITGPLSTGVTTIFPERVFRLNYDWFVRPNLVQHLGLGVNRSVEFNNRDNLDKDWAAAIGLGSRSRRAARSAVRVGRRPRREGRRPDGEERERLRLAAAVRRFSGHPRRHRRSRVAHPPRAGLRALVRG